MSRPNTSTIRLRGYPTKELVEIVNILIGAGIKRFAHSELLTQRSYELYLTRLNLAGERITEHLIAHFRSAPIVEYQTTHERLNSARAETDRFALYVLVESVVGPLWDETDIQHTWREVKELAETLLEDII
jgi:hypothetical protein